MHEVQGISLLAEELTAFQEDLCYMELGLLLTYIGNTISLNHELTFMIKIYGQGHVEKFELPPGKVSCNSVMS